MTKTDLFLIDGKPMFAPDANISFSFEDLDDADSGRDESGVMHRIVIRHNVMSVSFEFSQLTYEEYKYMESLFANKATFSFTRPDSLDPEAPPITSKCYRSKYGIIWQNAKTGMCKNYKFNIIEC